ncbi:hypothetical protein [Pseudoalteromonas luteoviolacea]|uniref:Uncharacterized protein n=1 Tax=Pseudoalteromonas luteoviolacea H33 TaxID=1365251 RepID=A0A162A5M2_9GAMM|nr:hypothetical protein [Pseudoalteromonas luteoviolacea]KZN45898.1 hypothetical protein N476_24830 [Pseudoalteromonas luteoviolacea H33]KZN76908.1 hypothetical protein N477_14120 [Pseudoalteromonas luteoviolacea H33-S]MBQ4879016.1 hypothetical protein [Pseudoalteromonas luteoviolacea]MBQ4908033.1 hypothetical protein [Pseudoalteromonas luteoviolacea]
MLTRIIGYILFVPFIAFYSYILGPVLKLVLIPGGLMLFVIILGPKEFSTYWHAAFNTQPNELKSVPGSQIG